MSEVLKKFGKYFLLDHLAQGGFSDIFRARLATPDGASRIIVIKRIQAGYDANSEFIQMFKSETKISMALNHPNIVQVFDVGEEAGQPFIAMELVQGRNLRQILSRLGENQKHLSPIHAAYIIHQAANALAYAHEFRDPLSDVPLNLVHRDISPQNIMVTFDGTIKVIDFGIAKATTNSEHTRTGVIKGKPSYFSPEQIIGDELDGRSDLFALGIVLWELLTTKKLFFGESDIAIIKQIEACNSYIKPPSSENPQVPKALDNIVLKSLQRNRDHRHSRMAELSRDLYRFVLDFDPNFQPTEISDQMREIFADLIEDEHKKLKALNEKAEALIKNQPRELPAPPNARSTNGSPQQAAPVARMQRAQDLQLDTSVSGHALELENNPKLKIQTRGTREMPSGTSRATTLGGVTGGAASRGKTQPSNSRTPGYRNSRDSSGPSSSRRLAIVAAALVGLIGAAGLGVVEVPVLSPLIAGFFQDGVATVQLEGEGLVQKVFVEGVERPIPPGSQLPFTVSDVPAGKRVEIKVIGPAGEFNSAWTFAKNETTQKQVVWSASGAGSTDFSNRVPSGVDVQGTGTQGNQVRAVQPGQIGLRINGFPNGPATQIVVNGEALGNGKFFGGVSSSASFNIQISREGWQVDEKQFSLELLKTREGFVDYSLKPSESVPQGTIEVKEPNGGELTIYTIHGEILHQGRIDQDEMLLKLPEGRYRILRSDQATGQSVEDLVNIVRDTRAPLSPWR
jgi:serine/threonine protein kinase